MDDDHTSMTVAFDLDAVTRLADPRAVFQEAKGWSEHVGVVFDGMGYQVVNYLRDRGVDNEDFFTRLDREKSLRFILEETDTDRHVLIGTGSEDEALAERTGWEYRALDAAAEAADWSLRRADGERRAAGTPPENA